MQGAKALGRRGRHSNEATPEPPGSVPEKAKLAAAELAAPAGWVSIWVWGAIVSLAAVVVTAAAFWAASVRQRRSVFWPSASEAALRFEVWGAGAPA